MRGKIKVKRKRERRREKNKLLKILLIFIGVILLLSMIAVIAYFVRESLLKSPEEVLVEYMNCIPEQDYEKMYSMVDVESSGNISSDDFVRRNSVIYEGIEIQNMTVNVVEYDKEQKAVTYQTSFDSVAGNISFENKAFFARGEDGYKLIWDDSLIFPELSQTDKVRVSTQEAKRGRILDRNGQVLAGKGYAASIGIVPGKLEDREASVAKIAELLGMEAETIESKLSAQWVKDDSFVPIQTRSKVEESGALDEEQQKEQQLQEELLKIPGVMISNKEVRSYPLGEKAAHLIGYVQTVTEEDLEQHAGEGYTSTDVIGKSGIESLFEKELKGKNGCRIYIVDSDGKEKEEIANVAVQDGEDIQLTIDTKLQSLLYEQFEEDKSCSVAMNPYTGEVLALVSTPSYDNNDFIIGLSSEQWNALSEDEDRPMYNRFRQTFCPGSVFKPITAAIGLETGAIDPTKDYGSEGTSWQKDSSWGSYYVTTLHTYSPVNLENALIYSDNIYFAKAALNIGAEKLQTSLTKLGFNEELPFDIKMNVSQYSNADNIETEIQLADSGYGQGQILINPLHLSSIYTAFCNGGNIIQPYLVYQEEATAKTWISGAFSNETASRVLEGMKKVVNNPNGTGYAAHRSDITLAGKTGTAEIKASKEDSTGTELGWFSFFTADKTTGNPVLITSMVEDVKNRGGSGYVVQKDSRVLSSWLSGQ